MTKGRKPKQWDAACTWLGLAAVGGKLIPVKYIMESGPACMATMRKARLEMGLEAIKTKDGWFWRYPAIPMHKQDKSIPKPRVHMKPHDYKEDKTKPTTLEEINKTLIEKGMSPYEPIVYPADYEPEPRRIDTKEMIESVAHKILQGMDTDDIIREFILACTQYPMPHPYSKEYIRSVVMHAIEGTPIRHDLNNNENKA